MTIYRLVGPPEVNDPINKMLGQFLMVNEVHYSDLWEFLIFIPGLYEDELELHVSLPSPMRVGWTYFSCIRHLGLIASKTYKLIRIEDSLSLSMSVSFY